MIEQFTYQGHHRIWHVLEPAAGRGRVKFSEPREDVLWFDRRCFEAEEPLLVELARLGDRRVPSVRVYRDGGSGKPLLVQDFIEGRPLSALAPRGTPVPSWCLDAVLDRFGRLAAVGPDRIRAPRRCTFHARARDGRSGHFFRTLIDFTHRQGYRERLPAYGPLFDALGVPPDALAPGSWLDNEAKALTPRPFCLLHGDLHRANFIADRRKRLWTIDWELAMVGDPLYDLATHLHLMDYPVRQQDEVVARWYETVPKVLPGADAGIDADLPRYRAYKCAQSVFTDIVREAQKLGLASPGERTAQLRATGETVRALLERAADVLGMGSRPTAEDVAAAYAEHALSGAPAPPGAADGPGASAATRHGGRAAASPRGR